jgi:hypothetical protein
MRNRDINDIFETFWICCTQKKKSVYPFDKCQHLALNWNRRWRLVPGKVDMDALVRIAVHCIAARTGKFRGIQRAVPAVPSPQLRCRGSRLSYTWRAAIDSNTEVPDNEAPIQVRHAQDQDNGVPNDQAHKNICLRCASMSNTSIPCNHLCMTAQIQKNKAVIACDVEGCRKTFKKNWKMTK